MCVTFTHQGVSVSATQVFSQFIFTVFYEVVMFIPISQERVTLVKRFAVSESDGGV